MIFIKTMDELYIFIAGTTEPSTSVAGTGPFRQIFGLRTMGRQLGK